MDLMIMGETAHHPLHILFQPGPLRRIVRRAAARGLNPAGVVREGAGSGLFPQGELTFPAVVEEDEPGADSMTVGNFEVSLHAVQESGRVLFPEEVVKVDPHDVHSDLPGVPQFPVDGRRIETLLLPHFQLVDCGGWNEVGAEVPGRIVSVHDLEIFFSGGLF